MNSLPEWTDEEVVLCTAIALAGYEVNRHLPTLTGAWIVLYRADGTPAYWFNGPTYLRALQDALLQLERNATEGYAES